MDNHGNAGDTVCLAAHLEHLAAAAPTHTLQLGVARVAHNDCVLILPHSPSRLLLLLLGALLWLLLDWRRRLHGLVCL